MSEVRLATPNESFLNLHTNRGISEDAYTLQNIIDKIFAGLFQSVALGDSLRVAFRELLEVYQECLIYNWDGYGAKAVDPVVYKEAQRFLEILPTSLPVPEIVAEPDGEIAFEWFKKPGYIFSVSIGKNNELTYAGIFGASKTHGIEYLGDELPKPVLENLCKLFSSETKIE